MSRKIDILLKEAIAILNSSKIGRQFKPIFLDVARIGGDLYIPPEIPLPGKRRLMAIAYQLQRCRYKEGI